MYIFDSLVGSLLAIMISFIVYKYKMKREAFNKALAALEWLRFIARQNSLCNELTSKILVKEKLKPEYLNESIIEAIRLLSVVRFMYGSKVEKIIDDFEDGVADIHYNFYWECDQNLPIHDELENYLETDRIYCTKSEKIYLATCEGIRLLKEKTKFRTFFV